MTNQTTAIYRHLKEGNSITPLEALQKFGCLRLGARIWDIKKLFSVEIETKNVKVGKGKYVAEYRMV